MAVHPEKLLRHLRRVSVRLAPHAETDAALLGQFVQGYEEAAFAALVGRYGPLVLGVCQRVLGNVHEAEDVAQATFLVLARKAAAIQRPDALSAWLHGTARRLALRYRRSTLRRRHRETESLRAASGHSPPHPLDELTARELLLILDEEIQRLPEVYRLPLLLCCLEGRSQEEAARQLGWTPGSVRGRLERGRARLHARLARRGLLLSAALAAVTVARAPAVRAAGVLGETLVREALDFARGALPLSRASALPRRLASAALSEAMLVKLRILVLGVLVVGLVTVGVLARPAAAPSPVAPADEPPRQAAQPTASQDKPHDPADRYGDPLPRGAIARLGTVRFRLGGLLHTFAYSPDGKRIAAGGAEQAIDLFDAATGQPLRRLRGSQFTITSLTYAPDGRTLVSGSSDQSIAVWDPATGKLLRQFHTPAGPVWSLIFSPDGKELVSAGGEPVLRIWDPATGKELRQLAGHQQAVRALVLSADGRTLASGGNAVRLWELATGKAIRRLVGPKKPIRALALSPDGSLVAAAYEEGPIALWETSSGKLRGTLPENAGQKGGSPFHTVRALAFSPDGKALVAGSADYTLRRWDLFTRKERWELPGTGSVTYTSYHDGGVQALAFAPDGRRLTVGKDSQLAFLDANTGQEIQPLPLPRSGLWRLFFRADGRRLVTTSDDPAAGVMEWDAATGQLIRRVPGKALWPRITALSPDQKILASTWHGAALHLWDTTTGNEIRAIPLPLKKDYQSPQEILFAPDGKRLAVAASEGEAVWLIDPATGKIISTVENMGNPAVNRLAFSADGRRLAAGARTALSVAEVPSGRPLQHIPMPKNHFAGPVALSPDGRTLASPCNIIFESKMILWETASGKERLVLPMPPGDVYSVAFSPDGRLLAAAGSNRVILVWDTITGKLLDRLEGHQGALQELAFSPDGRRLASTSLDTTALVWDVGGLVRPQPPPAARTSKEIEALWSALAGEDAVKAYQAVLTLEVLPEQAAPLLAERLRRRPATDSARTEHLLAQLESSRFAEREKATEELRRLGWKAEEALCRMLAGKPSLEARKRGQELLAEIHKQKLPPEWLQRLRGIEVLEHLDTSAAEPTLRALAAGPPEARLTEEARASIERRAKHR